MHSAPLQLEAGVPADQWDATVLALHEPHLLQSASWGDLKARWGWTVRRLSWTEDRDGGPRVPVAAAQLLVRRVGRTPLRIGYVPKGPLLGVSDAGSTVWPEPAAPDGSSGSDSPRDPVALWTRVLGDLETVGRQLGLAYIKIDPDVRADDQHVIEAWRRLGWRPSPEQIQFPNTMVSDLTVGEEALLEGMKPKTRYNVKLAAQKGVVVRDAALDGIAPLYSMYHTTGARAGFGLRSAAYYADLWRTFVERGEAAILLAEHQGQPLAGAFIAAYGDTVWYLNGASANEGRELMASYAVQWAGMKWAMGRGARTYDWWGGATRREASDPMWGVHRFKEGFGARWREQVGAWDRPLNPVAYRGYQWLDRVRRRRLAKS